LDSDEEEQEELKKKAALMSASQIIGGKPAAVNGKKEAIFLADSSDDEKPVRGQKKAAPASVAESTDSKATGGFQKHQKKSEETTATPAKVSEQKIPSEPGSATLKKGNGPIIQRKASETPSERSATKKKNSMEEEKETEDLFKEMYKKAPEDVENGPTQFLPTLAEDSLKVPVLSINHVEPKGKPIPKKIETADSGVKDDSDDEEQNKGKKVKESGVKQNGKGKAAEKAKDNKETKKGKAKSAQKPALKLRKSSRDVSNSSGSNLMSPTEKIELKEGLSEALAKISKKPATTGKAELATSTSKKKENQAKAAAAKNLKQDTSETSSDSEIELYRKKPVAKNVNLFL